MGQRSTDARGDFDRVAVVGTSCSGKTTFARALAARRSCSHVELDAVHWMPDWQSRPAEQFRAIVERLVADERWVIDGNYAIVRDLIWSRATAIVWLNYPFPQVFSRALRRTIVRAYRNEELFSGNRETFRQSFLSRDSILWWVLKTYRRHRREYRRLLDGGEYHQIRLVEFQRTQEAEAFLRSSQEDR